jgi:hypothetical protein
MRLVLLLLGACGTAVATVPIIVDLGYAKYEGIRNETLGYVTQNSCGGNSIKLR